MSKPVLKVLVIGATGSVGRLVVAEAIPAKTQRPVFGAQS